MASSSGKMCQHGINCTKRHTYQIGWQQTLWRTRLWARPFVPRAPQCMSQRAVFFLFVTGVSHVTEMNVISSSSRSSHSRLDITLRCSNADRIHQARLRTLRMTIVIGQLNMYTWLKFHIEINASLSRLKFEMCGKFIAKRYRNQYVFLSDEEAQIVFNAFYTAWAVMEWYALVRPYVRVSVWRNEPELLESRFLVSLTASSSRRAIIPKCQNGVRGVDLHHKVKPRSKFEGDEI